MRRISVRPRENWREIVESQGLVFHTLDDGETPYWDESSYYVLTRGEVDELERATYELDRMCLAAVEHVLEHRLLAQFGVSPRWHEWLCESWQRDERTIVGRFDLVYDGTAPPAMLEYNADTPTALLEAAVIQWYWFRDQLSGRDGSASGLDQFNSLHEKLIDAWKRVGQEMSTTVHFASLSANASVEDFMTVTYLRDTALQAGLRAEHLEVQNIGWNAGSRSFVDLEEQSIHTLFKLYPWEWLLDEQFSENLPMATTRWLEPPWKVLLSSKALLPLLYELFPESPYVLKAQWEPWGDTYVRKPIFSREGANVSVYFNGQIIADTSADDEQRFVYQEFSPLPSFDRRRMLFGSWMVNGHACGIGIRESDGLITGNTSRFVPHMFAG